MDIVFLEYQLQCTSQSGLCPTPTRIFVSTCSCDAPVRVLSSTTATYGRDPSTGANGLSFDHPAGLMKAAMRSLSPNHKLRVEPVRYILYFGKETVTGTVNGVGGVSCHH
jgi:hypothetical protein